MQQYTATNKTYSTKSSDNTLLKISLAYLEINSMTDDVFGMTASMGTNYHIAFNEIDIIFDGNPTFYL